MIQEYLFINDENKEIIESLDVDSKIQKEVTVIENSSCWILNLYIEGENEESAKLLDNLNTKICKKYTPIVLSNGCSAYFNKSLFPIINEFERKLRKLLYLASALQGVEESDKVIKNLEEKDLGEIFCALFTDSTFVKGVKEKVNQKTWQFTRDELIKSVAELEENVLWDTLLGSECVNTLRKSFDKVKLYRNDVMHAHNIDLTQFRAAKRLFGKVNAELDVAIGELIGSREENAESIHSDFNGALSAALENWQKQSGLGDAISATETLNRVLEAYPSISTEVTKRIPNIGGILSGDYANALNYLNTLSNLNKLSTVQEDILPAVEAISQISEKMEAYKLVVPPEVTKLQKSLSKINWDNIPLTIKNN